MSLDSRTPVLVGVGAVQQRLADPARAREPVELMLAALERAADDAGSHALLARADSIRAPRGFWGYRDPCRIAAQRFGATSARTEVAEVGVLQTTLLARAARDIAVGRSQVALVMGGEARFRERCARRAGGEAPQTRQPDSVAPDAVLRPAGEILDPLELRCGLAMPVGQYAVIENALRAAEGLSLEDHLQEVAELWSAMSGVAAENPDAWSRERVAAETIRAVSHGNRMLAFPYTRLHNSQWNVDQAAGLVLCSVGVARSLGVPRERWVFPLAVAESNHMLPLSRRRALDRCVGFAHAGRRASQIAGRAAADAEHVELYSCFPSAVRVQRRELSAGLAGVPSLTGGMSFAGGPLNNFVLQALVRMATILRSDPGSLGLLTAVSGVLTKQGVSLWSSEPSGPFGYADVSAETERSVEAVEVVPEASGGAAIASYTVLHEGGKPAVAVLFCDLDDGRRALVTSRDAALADELTHRDFCGCRVRLAGPGAPELA